MIAYEGTFSIILDHQFCNSGPFVRRLGRGLYFLGTYSSRPSSVPVLVVAITLNWPPAHPNNQNESHHKLRYEVSRED